MEKAVFGMDTLNVSQGMNGSFSHQGTLALDVCGKDSGIESMRAPFTGTIKRIYKGYVVWLESNNKVKYADGTEDYITVMVMHDNNTSDLKVGQVIRQGQIFFQEGTKGYATGNHIHLACGKGKFSGTGWYKNSKGQWCINNQYDTTKALFLLNSCKIKNAGGYKWVKTSDYTYNKPVSTTKYLNLKPSVSAWTTYKTNKYYQPLRITDVAGKVKPKKFGGLSYKIHQDMGNYHFKIKTDSYGFVYIAGNPNKYSCTITTTPAYKNGNY